MTLFDPSSKTTLIGPNVHKGKQGQWQLIFDTTNVISLYEIFLCFVKTQANQSINFLLSSCRVVVWKKNSQYSIHAFIYLSQSRLFDPNLASNIRCTVVSHHSVESTAYIYLSTMFSNLLPVKLYLNSFQI